MDIDELFVSNILGWVITVVLGGALAIIAKKYQNLKTSKKSKDILNEATGIISTYKTREEAVKDQMNNLTDAEEISFLAYNGFALLDTPTLLDSSLMKIIQGWRKSGNKKFKLLFLNPKNKDIISKRIERLNIKEKTATESVIRNDQDLILRNSRLFLEVSNSNPVEVTLKYFDFDLLWCLISYDKHVLLSFYQAGITAKHARTILLLKDCLLGKSLTNFFDYLWKKGKRVSLEGIEKCQKGLT